MRRFRRTTLITVGCVSVLAGLGLSRRFYLEPQLWWLLLAPLILLFRRKNITTAVLVILLGLGVGLWRGGGFMQKLDELKAYSGHKVLVEATALTDAVYSDRSQLEFIASDVQLLEPEKKPLVGKFKVSGFGEPMIYRGDRLQAEAKLFPMRGSNQARMAYAQLERVGFDNSWLNKRVREFKAGMQNALPEPLASFGLGILVGQRNTMPETVVTQLTIVGLVHIVAVSGYNLTILVRGVTRLKFGSKYQQLALSLSLIVIFVLITGFSASIVRAALVSILSLWAWYYGRQIRPLTLIAFVAALTGFVSPFYVWSDLGWYLSFLAFFGILVIAPIISQRFFKKRPKILTLVVLETLAAEVMTLPVIMMTLGQLSLVALIANVIVVPLVPWAMLLAAIAAAAGTWLTPIAGWFAWPAKLLLTFILDIVQLLASIPSALVHLRISLPMLLSFYALVVLTILVTLRRLRSKTGIITEESKV